MRDRLRYTWINAKVSLIFFFASLGFSYIFKYDGFAYLGFIAVVVVFLAYFIQYNYSNHYKSKHKK